jgi:hypothetical protein
MRLKFRRGAWIFAPLLFVASIFSLQNNVAQATNVNIPNAGFEDNSFTGWSKGTQTGTLGSSITGQRHWCNYI